MPVTLQIREPQGDLWKQLLNPASINISPALFHYLTPSPQALGVIGREAIRSVRGERMMDVSFSPNGVPTETPQGQYPYGILQRRSPDGTPYRKLSPKTMKNRTFKHLHNPDVSLEPSHILRETGKHLLGDSPQSGGGGGRGGLHIIGVDWGSGYGAVTVGYIDRESWERAEIHDQGLAGMPQRHFLGLQPDFFEQLARIGKAWLQRAV